MKKYLTYPLVAIRPFTSFIVGTKTVTPKTLWSHHGLLTHSTRKKSEWVCSVKRLMSAIGKSEAIICHPPSKIKRFVFLSVNCYHCSCL